MAPVGPAIILVAPQMGENIGATARAMYNFGLTDLRLVRPRDGWTNPDAVPMASGAKVVLDNVQVFGDTRDAVADLQYVVATTARPRDLIKPIVLPHEAVGECRARLDKGLAAGILFGAERSGLPNEDVVLSDAILQVATNPDFSSINLAQAVLLVSYEWFKTGLREEAVSGFKKGEQPATREELFGFMDHMERELDTNGFFYPPEKKFSMMQSLRNIWMRADFREQDIRTLRGVISALVKSKKKSND